MDRGKKSRAGSLDPSSLNEELQMWSQICADLCSLEGAMKKGDLAINKINKYHKRIAEKKADGNEEALTLKAASKVLKAYDDCVEKCQEHATTLQTVTEELGVLAALRDATENGMDNKRKKRKIEEKPKMSTPSGSKKAKIMEEPPSTILLAGTQVAVRPMNQDWLLAIVLRWMPEKGKYEVEDAEDDEEKPGTRKKYIFPPKLVIPIPTEVSRKNEFPPGTDVLALYPASTCFYKAVVVLQPSKNKHSDSPGTYIVKFEDDGDHERFVEASMVFKSPKVAKLTKSQSRGAKAKGYTVTNKGYNMGEFFSPFPSQQLNEGMYIPRSFITTLVTTGATVVFVSLALFTADVLTGPTAAPARRERYSVNLATTTFNLTPNEEPAVVEFHIHDAASNRNLTIADLTVTMQRHMHILFVSRDLTTLGHVHRTDFPNLNQQENESHFRVAFPLSRAGVWAFSVEFLPNNTCEACPPPPSDSIQSLTLLTVIGGPNGGTLQTGPTSTTRFKGVPFDRPDVYVGPLNVTDLAVNPTYTAEAVISGEGGTLVAGRCSEATFTFRTVGSDGGNQDATLTPYLGAYAHITAAHATLSSLYHFHAKPSGTANVCGGDGENHHAHMDMDGGGMPDEFGGVLTAGLQFTEAGMYRVFVQVGRGREMLVGGFLFEVGE
ncbi:hypothetical protein HK104_003502 [Borealophlyctis nickersoniae]|nr:hypothetical protein HK104_003502 [Borealophlyctis nickersoniae]